MNAAHEELLCATNAAHVEALAQRDRNVAAERPALANVFSAERMMFDIQKNEVAREGWGESGSVSLNLCLNVCPSHSIDLTLSVLITSVLF